MLDPDLKIEEEESEVISHMFPTQGQGFYLSLNQNTREHTFSSVNSLYKQF